MFRSTLLALATLLALSGCAPIPMADEAHAWGHDTRFLETPRAR